MAVDIPPHFDVQDGNLFPLLSVFISFTVEVVNLTLYHTKRDLDYSGVRKDLGVKCSKKLKLSI